MARCRWNEHRELGALGRINTPSLSRFGAVPRELKIVADAHYQTDTGRLPGLAEAAPGAEQETTPGDSYRTYHAVSKAVTKHCPETGIPHKIAQNLLDRAAEAAVTLLMDKWSGTLFARPQYRAACSET